MIPAFEPDGVLPHGGHQAMFDEIHLRLVERAGSRRDERERIWSAFLLWASTAKHYFGSGQIRLGGSFVANWPFEPELKVSYMPRNPSMIDIAIKRGERGVSLFTMRGIFYSEPGTGGSLSQLRAVGGMLDAQAAHQSRSDGWDIVWSFIDHQQRGIVPAGFIVTEV